MTTWNKIETAPKDGTKIDLWVSGQREIECWYDAENKNVTPYWEPDESDWLTDRGHVDGTMRITAHPTHWMPTPEGPE